MLVYGISMSLQSLGSFSSCIGTNCSCPASSRTTHNYGGFIFGIGTCTAFDTSNQSKFEVGFSVAGAGGPSGQFIQGGEYSGTTGSVDTGSEAAASALSTSYTTAANNEITFTTCFDGNANPLTPNSGEAQVTQSYDINSVNGDDQQLFQQITTVSAGSHTTSCAMSAGSARSLISTISIGLPSVASPNVPRKKGWIGE
jgi:hypothetical protein